MKIWSKICTRNLERSDLDRYWWRYVHLQYVLKCFWISPDEVKVSRVTVDPGFSIHKIGKNLVFWDKNGV